MVGSRVGNMVGNMAGNMVGNMAGSRFGNMAGIGAGKRRGRLGPSALALLLAATSAGYAAGAWAPASPSPTLAGPTPSPARPSGTVAPPAAPSPSPDPALAKVLAQIDLAASRFQSAQADFVWDQYTAVVQSHDVQKGAIAFRRGSKSVAMVAHIKTDNDQPSPKEVLFKDGEVRLYQPEIKQVTILSAGGNRQQYESYSTLGFGGSGHDLAANWNITDQGQETIAGISTVKLDLTLKQPGPNPMFTHIVIWLDPNRDVSLKQQFFEPSGDTRTATYSNIQLNKTSDNLFNLKTAPGTQFIRK